MMMPVINKLDENTRINDYDLTRNQTIINPVILPWTSISTNLSQRTQTTTQNWTDGFLEEGLNNKINLTTSNASNEQSILISNPLSFELYEDRFVRYPQEMASTSKDAAKKNTKICISALRANFSALESKILVNGHGKNRKFIALPARFNLSTILNFILFVDKSVLRANDFLAQKTLNLDTECKSSFHGPDNGSDLSSHEERILTDLTSDDSVGQSPIANIVLHFSSMLDPRIERTKDHNFFDIIVIAICAIVCGANYWTDVAKFGRAKKRWFQSFLELPKGIPSHDTFRRVFMLLDPEEFQKCFLSWVKAVSQVTDGEIIAIDGKQLRRSHDKKLGKKAIHMVSAWATQNKLVLGQVKVDSKSNEITAIPKLLEMLEISGCIITIDAMGCQKEIARQIIDKKGDYVLSLKMNHKTLFLQVKELFTKLISDKIKFDYHMTEEISHGRLEIRQCWTIQLVDLAEPLYKSNEWQKLKTIIMIKSQRFFNGKEERETRYFISSLASNAKKHLETVRSHWGIENSLHWVLDMAFREDESRLRTGHGPQNLAILRHLAINLLKHETSSPGGIQSKRLEAGWNEDYLVKVLSL